MRILGFDSGAQIIVLQGLSTYAGLLSAYFFARPVLRGQAVQSHRDLLAALESSDPTVKNLLSEATSTLNKRILSDKPSERRHYRTGIILLVASIALFTGALLLQIYTDPSFVQEQGAMTKTDHH